MSTWQVKRRRTEFDVVHEDGGNVVSGLLTSAPAELLVQEHNRAELLAARVAELEDSVERVMDQLATEAATTIDALARAEAAEQELAELRKAIASAARVASNYRDSENGSVNVFRVGLAVLRDELRRLAEPK